MPNYHKEKIKCSVEEFWSNNVQFEVGEQLKVFRLRKLSTLVLGYKYNEF